MIILIQLAKWFWALFPALIGIMSPTGAYNKQSNLDLQQSQLVDNSDLLIPKTSPNENEPLGFSYYNSTDISLNNGIAKFTATQQFGGQLISTTINSTNYIGHKLYLFSRFKSDSNNVKLIFRQGPTASHSGDNNYNLISMINDITISSERLSLSDYRTSDWTPIEVDYIGAIDLTTTFGDNIPDKQVLDDFILNGERFLFTDDTTSDNWFNTGFTDESRDILDIIGYFFWLAMPIIGIYWIFRLLLQII